MKLIKLGSAIILTMFTAPAFAQTSTDVTHTQIILTKDLNLSRPEDVRIFKHRASIAVVDVCGATSGIDLEGALDVIKCRHDLAAQTRTALLRATEIAQRKGRSIIQTADVNKFPFVIDYFERRAANGKD